MQCWCIVKCEEKHHHLIVRVMVMTECMNREQGRFSSQGCCAAQHSAVPRLFLDSVSESRAHEQAVLRIRVQRELRERSASTMKRNSTERNNTARRGEANLFDEEAEAAFDARVAAAETPALRHIRERSERRQVEHEVRAGGQVDARALEQLLLVGAGADCTRDTYE